MSFFQMSSPLAARRLFLGRTGLPLSGVAVALLAGSDALATKVGGAGAQDVPILNTPPSAPSSRRSPPINWATRASCCSPVCRTSR